jgi:hypothetical protein
VSRHRGLGGKLSQINTGVVEEAKLIVGKLTARVSGRANRQRTLDGLQDQSLQLARIDRQASAVKGSRIEWHAHHPR